MYGPRKQGFYMRLQFGWMGGFGQVIIGFVVLWNEWAFSKEWGRKD